MINLVMPMGGGGTRFANHFPVPKPLIPIQNRPFFYWSANAIVKHYDIAKLIFITLKDYETNFQIAATIKNCFPQSEILLLDQQRNGAVLTCLEAVSHIDNTYPVIFNDCDHLFFSNQFSRFINTQPDNSSAAYDAAIFSFFSSSPKYSYAARDKHGLVTGTAEKQIISSHAICGAYFFQNISLFDTYAAEYLSQCPYDEFFMSGLYNVMLKHNKRIACFETDLHLSFGTPEEYQQLFDNPLFQYFA